MKLYLSKSISVIVVGTSLMSAIPVKADSYVPCSFNYQVIACTTESIPGGLRITWRDGKKMSYYGQGGNNQIYTDTLGGKWKYLDFAMGKSASLSNIKNGNVIIWNGTYREYGRYVGL